jgi:WD40 repeat protein
VFSYLQRYWPAKQSYTSNQAKCGQANGKRVISWIQILLFQIQLVPLHLGAVYGIATSPFNGQLFATCGADGSLRMYSQYQTKHVLSLEPCVGALFALQWSPFRPLVAAAGTAVGLYTLTHSLKAPGDPTLEP